MKLGPGARVGLGLLGTLLLPVVVVGLSVLAAVRFTALPSDVALRVGPTSVSKAELKLRVELLGALYGVRAPADPARQDEFRRASAQTIALGILFDQAAAQEGIVVDERAGRQALDDFVKQRFPDGQAGFVKLLSTVGASEQDVITELRRQRSIALLFQKVTAGTHAPVSDDEARRFYQAHLADFVEPERRHLRNIVVSTKPEADRIVAQVNAGADFAALARTSTLDQATQDAGGDLGWAYRSQLEPEFADTAFRLAPNVVSDPVRTQEGWDVLQVLEVQPSRQLTYEQVGARLKSDLVQQRGLDAWRSWSADRISAGHIEYADDYRPVNPNPLALEPR